MRHKKSFNHLGRKPAHRKAMLSNMACSLIKHKRIETTTAKAKALKRYIEPLITRSKDDSTHARRVVFSYLQDKETVSVLFRDVAAKVGDRPGGYTRIIKLGHRLGDNADMCIIELVDFNETMLAEKAATKKSTSRRRRGSKRKTEEAPAAAAATEVVATEGTEAVAEEQAVAEEVVEAPVEEAQEEVVATEGTEAVAEEQPVAEAKEAEAKPAEDKQPEDLSEAKNEDKAEEESDKKD